MKPFLILEPHVSFGWCGERPIFLDLCRDRYFALPREAEDGFRTLAEGGSLDPSSETGAALLGTGLFARSATPNRPKPAQTESLAGDPIPSGQADLIVAAGIWLSLLRIHHSLRTKPFVLVLKARRRREPAVPDDLYRLRELAGMFRAARCLVPVKPKCLPDSLALRDWLAARAGAPDLVFGVKLHPFAAHCWVQWQGIVLNDAPDRVREFAPVFVLQ
ncbi:MAG TPA: lasso peptide biosynthesis B2 protein [Sphingomicrobium sp.]|nr:lasso peptide biosynthesis B2 protein [Sphingomicrobium sp.]